MPVRVGILGMLCLLAASGCSESAPTPILGKIKLDGAPLEGAMVTVLPAGGGGGTGAVAQSAADGSFKCIPHGGESLPPGAYKVVVTKLAIPKPGDPPPTLGSSPIPPIYRDAKTTPLEFDLPQESLDIEIDSSKK